MSDFSGRTPTKIDILLPNGGFFPDIQVGEFQEVMRVPAEWREASIKMYCIEAITALNSQLKAARAYAQNCGITTLSMEQAELYKAAVYHSAKARLLENYPEMNRRERAKHDARDNSADFTSTANHENHARPLVSQLERSILDAASEQTACSTNDTFYTPPSRPFAGDSLRVALV